MALGAQEKIGKSTDIAGERERQGAYVRALRGMADELGLGKKSTLPTLAQAFLDRYAAAQVPISAFELYRKKNDGIFVMPSNIWNTQGFLQWVRKTATNDK